MVDKLSSERKLVTFEARLTSADQPRSRVWRQRERARGTFVIFHGVKSNGSWFDSLARALVERGFAAIAPDRRGSGLNRGLPGRDDPSSWISDVDAALQLAAREVAGPVATLGWCWGARQVLAAADKGIAAPRSIFVAPALVLTEEVRAARDANSARPPGAPTGDEEEMAPLPFTDDFFSDDPTVLRFIAADKEAWSAVPRAFLRASASMEPSVRSGMERLRGPAYALLVDGDRIADTPATRELFAKSSAVRVETLRGGHAIVLEHPGLVADRLAAFWDAADS